MFRPKIIGFVCNWSLPIEVALAEQNEIDGYPKINIVRVTCVGRIDPSIVLKTFAKGADGVLVIGCEPPDCHYIEGNLQAEQKVRMLEKLLSRTGLEPERLRLEWIHTPRIQRFAQVVSDFRNHVMVLGPSSLSGKRPDANMLLNVEAARAVAEDFRLRILLGREKELIENRNMYGEEVSQEEFAEILDEVIDAEFLRNRIYLLVKKEPLSVKELSKHLDVDSRIVLRHLVVIRQRGWVTVDRVEGRSPQYTALEVGQ